MLGLELWRSAFDSLLVNKLRSVLTMIGIIVGVGSIITIVAIGQGGKSAIVNEIQSANPQDTVEIIPKSLLSQPGQSNTTGIKSFSPADFALVRSFSGVKDVYTTPQTSDTVANDAGKHDSVTVQSGPSYLPTIDKFKITAGRMYLPMDNTAHRHVAVITSQVAKDLFGKPAAAIGKFVSLQGQLLQVIGVSESTDSSPLARLLPGRNVYIPTSTFSDLYPGEPLQVMDVRIAPGQDQTALSARIIAVLNAKYHADNAFTNASSYIASFTQMISKVTTIITVIIGSIAAIALFVGGVGVMNIMLVSVTERTKEIGIRMSLGATRTNILWQFLVEAMVLTTLGGGLGILLGWLVAAIVSMSFHLPSLVSWQSVFGSFFFSAIVGILCGLYPASRASRLNPIEALRYE